MFNIGNCFDIQYKKRFPFVTIDKKNLFDIFFIALLVGVVAFFYETLLDYVWPNGKLYDRGFLIGPFLPIYFFCVFFGLCYIKTPKLSLKSILICFFTIGIGISLVEYVVGNVFEKLVGQKLWSYDGMMPLSFGYVSISVAAIWGILGTIILIFIVPLLKMLVDKIPSKYHLPIVITFLVLFILDLIFTAILIIKNGGKYKELYEFDKSLELSLFMIGIVIFIVIVVLFARFLYKSLYKFKRIGVIVFLVSLILPIISCIDYMHKSSSKFVSFLSSCGFIVAAIYIYFILSLLVLTLIRLIAYLISKKEVFKTGKTKSLVLLVSLISSLIISSIGMVNLNNYKITRFSAGNGNNSMKIIAVSDVHYGSTGTNINLVKLKDRINKEQADVVFLLGDIFDNKIKHLDASYFKENMNAIKAKYGVYAISGNHEYEYNPYNDVKEFYANTNINFLIDESVIIDNKIQVVGRLDAIYKNRRSLDSIIDKSVSLPLIVLDHQPQDYKDSIEANATLQLSGHTHNGQLWPANYLVNLYYKYYYKSNKTNGLYKDGDFTLYVTRGYGAWGFPLRTIGRSEMLRITFKY